MNNSPIVMPPQRSSQAIQLGLGYDPYYSGIQPRYPVIQSNESPETAVARQDPLIGARLVDKLARTKERMHAIETTVAGTMEKHPDARTVVVKAETGERGVFFNGDVRYTRVEIKID